MNTCNVCVLVSEAIVFTIELFLYLEHKRMSF